ncbi:MULTISPECIES: LysR substrate-binding domain-containing protein [Rhizobium]|uniref:HTH-type transcriptional regulator TtuA n=1 Tax=Rhizobium lusitanum TaxID=293958 RepID=A0A1C3WFA0_9HYPH|nr:MULTISPECIES: LysR substrate-binding domain-containing protein [Rhizobium]SCB38566.1 LysR family transcriptional regulator, glycine cleavage system transcriptional activator [Rhizobium lusitanum]
MSALEFPSLRSLQVLEAVARLGSFGKAAEELSISPSAVSHQMAALDSELGIALFHRSGRSIMLTDAGRAYAEEISASFRRIESATRNFTKKGKSDILNIHSVVSLASQWLMPRLARFSARYPEIDLRLHASGDPAELRTGNVDIDIRYGTQPVEVGIAVEPFPPEPIVVLCAPSLVEGANGIRSPQDLARFPLIHSEVNLYRWQDWADDHGVRLNMDRGLRFDRSFMSINAAADGLGVCLESLILVRQDLKSGRLVAPFGLKGPSINCHSLVYLRSRARTPKIALFKRWIEETLAGDAVSASEIDVGGR